MKKYLTMKIKIRVEEDQWMTNHPFEIPIDLRVAIRTWESKEKNILHHHIKCNMKTFQMAKNMLDMHCCLELHTTMYKFLGSCQNDNSN